MRKTGKKLLTLLLTAAMVIGCVPMSAFAADTGASTNADSEAGGQSGANMIEEGKTYLVPLDLYHDDELYQDMPVTNGIIQFIDNVAMVSKNSDGTYHVTVQVENYNKIEVLQFSKPGAISEDITPKKALMGTYNFPESFTFTNGGTAEDVRTAIANYVSEE